MLTAKNVAESYLPKSISTNFLRDPFVKKCTTTNQIMKAQYIIIAKKATTTLNTWLKMISNCWLTIKNVKNELDKNWKKVQKC